MTSVRHGFGAAGPFDAFTDGLMRVKRAPWLIIGLWMATFLIALPFAMLLQASIRDHLDASLVAQSVAPVQATPAGQPVTADGNVPE